MNQLQGFIEKGGELQMFSGLVEESTEHNLQDSPLYDSLLLERISEEVPLLYLYH